MRQFSHLTNLLLTCAFAALSVVTLGMPWYAPAERASGSGEGAMEAIGTDIVQFFSSSGATVAGNAHQPTALLAVAALTAFLAVLVLAGLRVSPVRDVLRLVPFAAPVLILIKAVDHPAPGQELRWGILASLVVYGLMASAALQGSQLTTPKPRAKAYVPPPPPAGSFSPPGA